MRTTALLVLVLALAACSRAEQPNDATQRDVEPAEGAGAVADTAPPVAQLPHVRYYRINAG